MELCLNIDYTCDACMVHAIYMTCLVGRSVVLFYSRELDWPVYCLKSVCRSGDLGHTTDRVGTF